MNKFISYLKSVAINTVDVFIVDPLVLIGGFLWSVLGYVYAITKYITIVLHCEPLLDWADILAMRVCHAVAVWFAKMLDVSADEIEETEEPEKTEETEA